MVKIRSPQRVKEITESLVQTEAERNAAFTRNAKPNPVIRAIPLDNQLIQSSDQSRSSNFLTDSVLDDLSQLLPDQQNVQRTLARNEAPRSPVSPPTEVSINTADHSAQAQSRLSQSGVIDPTTEANREARASIVNSDLPGDPSIPSSNRGIEETKTPETRIDDGDIVNGVNFEPNPLISLDNPTYNWRFFMAGAAANHNTISTENITIIAETGSSGFFITDAKIHSVISPGPDNKNAFATQIQFTVIEPQGNTLFDRIRLAAVDLGVDDHRNVPLWLELSFRGYSAAGENSKEGGLPEELTNERRLWQLKVRAVDIEINKGGTEYIFKCIPGSEIGYQDSTRRLERKVDLHATTLRDFFEKLVLELNRNNNNSTRSSLDNVTRTRGYAFKLPDANEISQVITEATRSTSNSTADIPPQNNIQPMSSWTIRGANSAFNKRSQTFEESEVESGRWHIAFNGGDPIEAIVQEVIGATAEGQSLAIYGFGGGNVEDIQAAVEQRDQNIPSIAFTVEPIIDILSYNGLAKDYNVLVTYHIRPYISFQPILSREHLEKAAKGESGKQRFERQLIISNIRKKYEYMYSGLNTEVLDYRIKFDRAWFLSLPIFQGQDRTAVGISSGAMTDVKSQLQVLQRELSPQEVSPAALKSLGTEIREAREQLQEDVANQRLADGQIGARRLQIQQLEEDLRQRANFESNRRQLQQLSNIPIEESRLDTSSFGAGRLVTLQNPVVAGSSGGNISVLELVQDRSTFIFRGDRLTGGAAREVNIAITSELGRSTSNRDGIGSATFVEEQDTVSVGRDISKSRNEEIIDVGTEISPTRRPNESNIEGTIGKGRSFFSAIMNQLYGSQGQMVNVEVEIRGDPYWLGETDPRQRVQGITDRDLTKSDSLMLMTFDFPISQGDGGKSASIDSHSGSGLFNIEGNRQNGFNGLYYIRKVESTFSNGKFTQKLIGHADPLTQEINVKRVARATNGNNR